MALNLSKFEILGILYILKILLVFLPALTPKAFQWKMPWQDLPKCFVLLAQIVILLVFLFLYCEQCIIRDLQSSRYKRQVVVLFIFFFNDDKSILQLKHCSSVCFFYYYFLFSSFTILPPQILKGLFRLLESGESTSTTNCMLAKISRLSSSFIILFSRKGLPITFLSPLTNQ